MCDVYEDSGGPISRAGDNTGKEVLIRRQVPDRCWCIVNQRRR